MSGIQIFDVKLDYKRCQSEKSITTAKPTFLSSLILLEITYFCSAGTKCKYYLLSFYCGSKNLQS
jgi:hypothetical protein